MPVEASELEFLQQYRTERLISSWLGSQRRLNLLAVSAVVVVAAAVLACSSLPPSETSTARPSGASAASAVPQLDAFWWTYVSWDAVQRPGRDPNVPWEPILAAHLGVGRLEDSPVVVIDRPFADPRPFTSFRSLEPFAHRAGAGGVAFGYFDGLASHVEWVDGRSGQAEPLFTSDRPIHNAVVTADRRTVFAVLLDEGDHREAGIWAFGLAAPKPASELLIPATGLDPENAGLVEEIALTPDESTLVVRDCFHECRVRTVDLASRTVATLARRLPTNTWVRGLTNRHLLYDVNCDLPCPLSSLDLRTGIERRAGRVCSSATVVAGVDEPLLVGDGGGPCGGDLSIVSSAVDSTDNLVEVYKTRSPETTIVTLGRQSDAFLPDGTFVVAAGGLLNGARSFPVLVNARTRETIPLTIP